MYTVYIPGWGVIWEGLDAMEGAARLRTNPGIASMTWTEDHELSILHEKVGVNVEEMES